MKIHLQSIGKDYRHQGQTDCEYFNSTKCGFVRDVVTNDKSKVTCKLCIREMNKSLKDHLRVSEYASKTLKDGEPCRHVGCLSHVSHPCEGCGRIQGRSKL